MKGGIAVESLKYQPISDMYYIGIVTVYDYEIQLNKYLLSLSLPPPKNCTSKIVVDMALKTGIDKYRFIEYEINSVGQINTETRKYVNVNDNIILLANKFLADEADILNNSILTLSALDKLKRAVAL